MFLRRPSDFFAFLFIFYLFLWILFISENNLRYVIPCNTVDVIYVIKTIPFYNAGVILPLKFQAEIYIYRKRRGFKVSVSRLFSVLRDPVF